MDSVNEKNWIKRLYFHRLVEMEQPHTTTAPFVCALVIRCASIFPQSLHLPKTFNFIESLISGGEWAAFFWGNRGMAQIAQSGSRIFVWLCHRKRLMLYSLELQRNKPKKYLSYGFR